MGSLQDINLMKLLRNEESMELYLDQFRKSNTKKIDPRIWNVHFSMPKKKQMSVLNSFIDGMIARKKVICNYLPSQLLLALVYDSINISYKVNIVNDTVKPICKSSSDLHMYRRYYNQYPKKQHRLPPDQYSFRENKRPIIPYSEFRNRARRIREYNELTDTSISEDSSGTEQETSITLPPNRRKYTSINKVPVYKKKFTRKTSNAEPLPIRLTRFTKSPILLSPTSSSASDHRDSSATESEKEQTEINCVLRESTTPPLVNQDISISSPSVINVSDTLSTLALVSDDHILVTEIENGQTAMNQGSPQLNISPAVTPMSHNSPNPLSDSQSTENEMVVGEEEKELAIICNTEEEDLKSNSNSVNDEDQRALDPQESLVTTTVNSPSSVSSSIFSNFDDETLRLLNSLDLERFTEGKSHLTEPLDEMSLNERRSPFAEEHESVEETVGALVYPASENNLKTQTPKSHEQSQIKNAEESINVPDDVENSLLLHSNELQTSFADNGTPIGCEEENGAVLVSPIISTKKKRSLLLCEQNQLTDYRLDTDSTPPFTSSKQTNSRWEDIFDGISIPEEVEKQQTINQLSDSSDEDPLIYSNFKRKTNMTIVSESEEHNSSAISSPILESEIDESVYDIPLSERFGKLSVKLANVAGAESSLNMKDVTNTSPFSSDNDILTNSQFKKTSKMTIESDFEELCAISDKEIFDGAEVDESASKMATDTNVKERGIESITPLKTLESIHKIPSDKSRCISTKRQANIKEFIQKTIQSKTIKSTSIINAVGKARKTNTVKNTKSQNVPSKKNSKEYDPSILKKIPPITKLTDLKSCKIIKAPFPEVSTRRKLKMHDDSNLKTDDDVYVFSEENTSPVVSSSTRIYLSDKTKNHSNSAYNTPIKDTSSRNSQTCRRKLFSETDYEISDTTNSCNDDDGNKENIKVPQLSHEHNESSDSGSIITGAVKHLKKLSLSPRDEISSAASTPLAATLPIEENSIAVSDPSQLLFSSSANEMWKKACEMTVPILSFGTGSFGLGVDTSDKDSIYSPSPRLRVRCPRSKKELNSFRKTNSVAAGSSDESFSSPASSKNGSSKATSYTEFKLGRRKPAHAPGKLYDKKARLSPDLETGNFLSATVNVVQNQSSQKLLSDKPSSYFTEDEVDSDDISEIIKFGEKYQSIFNESAKKKEKSSPVFEENSPDRTDEIFRIINEVNAFKSKSSQGRVSVSPSSSTESVNVGKENCTAEITDTPSIDTFQNSLWNTFPDASQISATSADSKIKEACDKIHTLYSARNTKTKPLRLSLPFSLSDYSSDDSMDFFGKD